MGKKARNRRSGREARQRERLEKLQQKAEAGTASEDELKQLIAIESAVDVDDVELSPEDEAAIAAANAAADDETKSVAKPRRQSPLMRYLKGVRLEMQRVTWPTRQELTKYSIQSIVLLVATGAAVWAIDNGLIWAVIQFGELRG